MNSELIENLENKRIEMESYIDELDAELNYYNESNLKIFDKLKVSKIVKEKDRISDLIKDINKDIDDLCALRDELKKLEKIKKKSTNMFLIKIMILRKLNYLHKKK